MDGIRAVSILLVIIGHAAATKGAPAWMEQQMFTSLGNIGVRFFFVLSGFLITTLLSSEQHRHGAIDLGQFYLRRVFRILPPYFFYLFVIGVMGSYGLVDLQEHVFSGTRTSSSAIEFRYALTFLYNYRLDYNWYFNHLWSLSVEEQFYLLWPGLLVMVGLSRGARVALAIVLVGPLIRIFMIYGLHMPLVTTSRQFQGVMDALSCGCCLALWRPLWLEHPTLRNFARSWFLPAFGAVGLLGGYGMGAIWVPGAYIVGTSLINIGIVALIEHCVLRPDALPGRLLNCAPMVFLGTLSYSLYLWQEPFMNFRATNWMAAFPQNVALAFAAALFAHFAIEKPFLALRMRIGRR